MLKEESEVANQKGTVFNQLRGDFIEEKYEAMCADTADVVLETICYCQTEHSSLVVSLQASQTRLNPNFDDTEQVSTVGTVRNIY